MTSKNNKIPFWIMILIVLIMPIITLGDNVGMYFDSVFPDYAATQILDPQLFQEKWFYAFPFLCQVYHGAVGVWITVFVMLITGSTSILQHHITYALIELLILFLIDKILSNNDVHLLIRRIVILILAVSPTLMTTAITQYFIELPGMVAVCVGLILFEKAQDLKNNDEHNWMCFWSFCLFGFAFYSYFNYLFFGIGFTLLLLSFRNETNRLKRLFTSCYGMLAGSSLYLCGFSISFFSGLGINYRLLLVLSIIVFVGVWGLCIGMQELINKNKERIVCILTGVLALMSLGAIGALLDNITNIMNTLSVGGYYKADILDRFEIIGKNFYYALTGISAERLILHEQVSLFWSGFIVLYLVITIVYFVFALMQKNVWNRITSYICILFIYLLCCVAFATRMQTQHFIPTVYWVAIIIGLELNYIFKAICNNRLKKSVSVLVIIIGLLCAGVMAVNRYRVIDRILETGGRGYYTVQINRLAENAIDNQQAGENEIYIFPEWGFMSSFNYLTGNDIAFTTNCDEANLRFLIDSGYKVNILYWPNENNMDGQIYDDIFEEAGIIENTINYYDNEGEVVFRNLTLVTGEEGDNANSAG